MITSKLEDLIDLIIDYRGKTPKKLGGDWSESGYRVFSAKNIKTGEIVSSESIRYVNNDLYRSWMKDEIQKGDILITSEAPFGQIYFWDSDEKIVLGQRLFAIRPKKSVNGKYLYYYMTGRDFQCELKARATGTTVTGLRQPELLRCQVSMPSKEQQDYVAHLLGTLDKKIQINVAINDNLMQQAETLYRYLFIKNASPKWRTGSMAELVSVRYGKDHKKLADGTIPVYGSGGVMRFVERPLYEHESVLIPRKGSLNNIIYVNQPFWSVDTMFYTEMKLCNVAKYVYFYLKSQNLAAMNVGSAVPSMTTELLNSLQIKIPSNSTLMMFESIVDPMFKTISHNQIEIKKLMQVRDYLLKKLFS